MSDSGILVAFDEPVELWITGEISLTVGEYYMEMHVRVARVQDNECGLSFIIRDDNDRKAIQILVDYATIPSQPVS